MTAHADCYRELRLRIDAALRERASDLVTVNVWSDGDVSVRARLDGDPPAPRGKAPVLVFVDGVPRWTAEHPLPERRAQTLRCGPEVARRAAELDGQRAGGRS